MSLLQTIRDQLTKAAVKENDSNKVFLRTLLGKIQTEEATRGTLNDEQIQAVVKGIINGNVSGIESTRAKAKEQGVEVPASAEEYFKTLLKENEFLSQYLPTYLTADQVEGLICNSEPTMNAIKGSSNAGAATGAAMKFLKSQNAKVEGTTVKGVVEKIYQR